MFAMIMLFSENVVAMIVHQGPIVSYPPSGGMPAWIFASRVGIKG